jgi:ATP-dependent Lon protease
MIKNKSIKSSSINDEMSNIDSNKFKEFAFEKSNKINDIIQNVLISLQKQKKLDIFSNSDLNVCIFNLNEIYCRNKELIKKLDTFSESNILTELQNVFNKTAAVVSGFGTNKLNDIFYLVFGKTFTLESNYHSDHCVLFLSKLNVITKHASYINYKTVRSKLTSINNKFECFDKISEEIIIPEKCNQLECLEPNTLLRSIDYSINGVRMVIQSIKLEKSLILSALIDDLNLDFIRHEPYIKNQFEEYEKIKNDHTDSIDVEIFERLLNSLTLKDLLIYSANDIYKKYISLIKDVEYVKANNLTVIVKKFLDMDIIYQRKFLINLLIYNKESDIHYAAYILYDILTPFKINTTEINIDSDKQNIIYNSLPWSVKMHFKDAMNCTMKYSTDSIKYDIGKISLEQQILLMKTNDIVKQKAMIKLKEIRGKPEDQGSKAKQYLEGLLKIPFEIYRKEPVLCKISIINDFFIHLGTLEENFYDNFPIKKKYTLFEIKKGLRLLKKSFIEKTLSICMNSINKMNKTKIKNVLKQLKIPEPEEFNKNTELLKIKDCISKNFFEHAVIINSFILDKKQFETFEKIDDFISSIQKDISNVKESLDNSIYAHTSAKKQILKIISQWINGEQKGYCFGFEGAPGIGKTSLAKKGLSNCLKDEDGISRPFAFIALGGSSNGPTLEGHNYTYVNSTWGKIIDTLMDAKCMNPIIYIDELDKVSKTEQGKEIIGILMHLIDSTQNDEFQDKYFNGIPIDLSRVLFIFSYNDPDQIDPILLDRIHRIKFDNLSSKDKHVICKKYVIPEINEKMGFDNVVILEDETLDYIIDNYTIEIGIRKLKEIIFDLYGEINIDLLACQSEKDDIEIPIIIKKEDLGKRYLKKYIKLNEKLIHPTSEIGIINGLWANSQGKGGIISIECCFFPTPMFLELHLTGMQGDVMKESMNVAKTLAWNLTSRETQSKCIKQFEETCNRGIHVHCPEGAVSKDGPSAGAAITIALYSLFNNKKIKHNFAITGEITLKGDITAIGGLELKILGGIRAGVKIFLYPESNQSDFDECNKKYTDMFSEKKISFIAVKRIQDVLSIIYE